MRDFTRAGLEALLNEETAEVFITLLEIREPSLPEPLYICNDSVAHSVAGIRYEPYPYSVILPVADGESLPAAQLVIGNEDRKLISVFRKMQDPVTAKITVVMASDTNQVRFEVDRLRLRQMDANMNQISFSILSPSFLSARCPAYSYSAGYFPALFG